MNTERFLIVSVEACGSCSGVSVEQPEAVLREVSALQRGCSLCLKGQLAGVLHTVRTVHTVAILRTVAPLRRQAALILKMSKARLFSKELIFFSQGVIYLLETHWPGAAPLSWQIGRFVFVYLPNSEATGSPGNAC